MVIYEWQDALYLGKQTSTDEYFPVRYPVLKFPQYEVRPNDFVASRGRIYVQVTH